MKRGFLILILALVILPSVHATIFIEKSLKDRYNLGEEVSLSGYVMRNTDFDGLMSVEFLCDNATFQLPFTALTLESGERKNFPQDFKTPKIIIPVSLTGRCSIRAALHEGGLLESITSESFLITKELEGDFVIDNTKIQLGRTFSLTGNAYRLDGDGIDGVGEVYFSGNGSRFLMDAVGIRDGIFKYDYEYRAIPQGNYEIDLLVRDTFGNQKLFEKLTTITLVNELNLVVTIDEKNVNPGSKIRLNGDVKTVLQENVNDANVEIEIDDKKFITNVKDGGFNYEIMLSDKIKSGKHLMRVTVQDEFGNKGKNEIGINVNQIPTSLVLKVNNNTINPGSVLTVEAILYDQAGDVLTDVVSIEIKDDEDKLIFYDSISTSEETLLEIDPYAKPGKYQVNAEVQGLTQESTFIVSEVVKLDITLLNQSLLMQNTGNVEFKKPIIIDLNKGFYEITKRFSLKLKDNFTILLNEEFPAGQYLLRVRYDDQVVEFKDVIIYGKKALSLNILYYILAWIEVALLILLCYKTRRFKRMNKEIKFKDIRSAKDSRKKIEETKKKRPRDWFKGDEKSDVSDFKERILKEIKETQEKGRDMTKSKKGSYYSEEEDKEDKSPFKMFD